MNAILICSNQGHNYNLNVVDWLQYQELQPKKKTKVISNNLKNDKVTFETSVSGLSLGSW